MKTLMGSIGASLTATLLVGAAALAVQDAPKKDAAQKEHQWLQQLAGTWQVEIECNLKPDQPEKSQATESVRQVGDLWVIAESEGTFMGEPASGVMTLGYDAEKQKYVGTSICDGMSHLWVYEGTLDPAGKTLTLETEGPDPLTGKTAKFRDVIEIKSPTERVLTSSMQKDGAWAKVATMTYRRAGRGG